MSDQHYTPETPSQLDQVAVEIAAAFACIGANGAELMQRLADDHRRYERPDAAADLDELAVALSALGAQCLKRWQSLVVDAGVTVHKEALVQIAVTLSTPRTTT